MKSIISSTLDKKHQARLLTTILVDDLIIQYQKQLKIDVSKYFKNIKKIGIYECVKTSYCFYYPFNIDGDSLFYQQLQEFGWYYMPYKWEHKMVETFLKGNERILEIGSGAFDFVNKMETLGFNITGLELNEDSVLKAKDKGLKAYSETVQEYAEINKENYDVVCSFQVLEHISEVHSFIKAQIDCLKIGGKLIIAVPNNDSFIRFTKNFILNSPPHHMGLWNTKSLISIAKLFNLEVESVVYEPLQPYHLNSYVNLMVQEKINKNKLTRVIFNKMRLRRLFVYLVSKFSNQIHGHTMLVSYIKV